MKVLVVKTPFGNYKAGDRIASPAQQEAILSGGHAHYVIPSDHADLDRDQENTN